MCIEEYTKEHSDYVRKIEDDRKNEKISQLEKESERKDKIIAEKDKQFETAVNGFVRLAKDGKLSVSEAAEYAGISIEEFEKLM